MAHLETVGTRVSRWGEGPVWHDGCLWYVDIKGHALVRLDPESGSEVAWPVGQEVGFSVPCRSGRWLFGGEKGLFFFDPSSGGMDWIIDPEPDLPNNRFNDGKCSPDGRLFAGTIATDKATGAARLYRLDSDLACTEAFGPVTNSNGLAWSGDGRTLFYIDTPSKEVKAFDYDGGSGVISAPRVVIRCPEEGVSPDGMCIDTEDHLWVAFCHGGRVARFDPSTGEEVERIPVPAHETTSCCFGGPEWRDLYITTGECPSREGDRGGLIFVVRGLPAGGRATVPFPD